MKEDIIRQKGTRSPRVKTEEPENKNCIECDKELERGELSFKYFCRKCYPAYATCHIRRREGINCMNCDRVGVDGFIWNRCQHVCCVQCYKDTPHQVNFEVQRAKNPNTRCAICAKTDTRNCEYTKNGRRLF